MSIKRVLSAALLTVLVACPMAMAQGSGRIEGSIARESGAGIGGVAVIVNEIGAAELSQPDGSFRFSGVAAGTYSMTFTLGDKVATEDGVVVTAGQTTRVDKAVDWTVTFAETITVVSASRRAERIVEAPAAVTLVTAQEIEREASHGQVPKLLEFTPGAEVTQSGVYDYNFNTRGFNSSLNRRVATLVDGRDLSVPFLGAQEWAAVAFPLDDIASLELVRGPSAALYGANASSGVLNLVTKAPRYSEGGVFRLAAGELSTVNADFRYARALGGDWYFKVLGGLRNSGDFTVSRRGAAEYTRPCAFTGDTDCLPQERVRLNPEDDNEIIFGGFRLDKYVGESASLTFEGGTANVEGPAFQTGIGRVQLVDIERPWMRANFNTPHWNFLGYITQRDAPRQTALASGANLALDTERRQFEVQTNWDFADDKARIVIGGSYAEEEIDSRDPRTGRQTLIFAPVDSDKQAIFGQLDWNATDKVKFVLAGRYDESSLHDSEFSPKASLVFSANSNNTFRVTYNEAFQVPNYSEFFLQAPVAANDPRLIPIEGIFCTPFGVNCGFGNGLRILALGNASLEVEEVETLEFGYSGILGGKAYLTLDYYRSDNQNFITDLIPQLGTALGRVNKNFGPYVPPSGLPPAVAAILVGTLQQALGPAYALLTNNLDGTAILGAVSYANFGKVDTEGLDLGLNYYFDDQWTFSAAFSWFDFEIKEDLPGFAQLLVPNSPEIKASAGLAYVGDKFDWDLSMRWVDDFRWAVGPFQGNVLSYTTFDFGANYKVNDRVKVGVNIANLFNDNHWESFGGDIIERRALGNIEFTW